MRYAGRKNFDSCLFGEDEQHFVLANLVVFAVTVILLLGINSMSSEIDKVYQGNLRLNEVSDALMVVAGQYDGYLNSKTSGSWRNFTGMNRHIPTGAGYERWGDGSHLSENGTQYPAYVGRIPGSRKSDD